MGDKKPKAGMQMLGNVRIAEGSSSLKSAWMAAVAFALTAMVAASCLLIALQPAFAEEPTAAGVVVEQEA